MWIFNSNPTRKQKIIHGVVSLCIIALSFSLFWFAKGMDWRYIITLKYLGFVIIAFFGSAVVFLPFPLAFFIGISGLFLNPIIVALLGAFVVTSGSMIPYLVGREGKIIFEDLRGYGRFHKWATKNAHGFWSILFISMFPFPLFDLICVSAGILGIKFKKFFLAVLAGKTISYLVIVWLFYYLGSRFPEFFNIIKSYLK
ncbi:VTT domain-containing protein [Candidatus Falkowbacteria bacterium]|nr:VTT domain-containing protein [Candidatus Falkowbacteria bacterium]